jgi:hypothetical protein
VWFAVPGGRADGRAGAGIKARGKQRHDREQREQAGRGACDGTVRPLALGLDAKMIAHLAEGHLHLPALDEPAHDLQRVARGIGAEQGLRVEAMPGIAQQHPADRHDRQAGVAPHSGGGADLDGSVALAIPAGYRDLGPAGVLVGQEGGEVRQAGTLGPRAPDRPGLARRRWLVQRRVQPQAGDADQATLGERRQEIERGEAAVAQQHDLAPGQPAACLKRQLPRPLGQLLVPPAALAAVAL